VELENKISDKKSAMFNRMNLFNKKKNDSNYKDLLFEIEKLYAIIPSDNGGGCSIQKGITMAAFIKELNLQVTADIGVYRGRSLFPQAISHKNYTKGHVYGIDPYSKVAAIQNDNPKLFSILQDFAEKTNFDQVYNNVISIIKENHFQDYCAIIRQTSANAKQYFVDKGIVLGLVHIDGNHDTNFVMNDVNDYYPLLMKGGIIILDDISWNSVKPAFDYLSLNSAFIGDFIDNQNDFAVFLVKGDKKQIKFAKKIFNQIKDIKN
jgi:hypothetical protein